MKAIGLLMILIVFFAVCYTYINPALIHYKDARDAQAYEHTNLLEGIDIKPLTTPSG